MPRRSLPAPTARVAWLPATTRTSSCSTRPTGAISPTTWAVTSWPPSSRAGVLPGRARLAPMATKKQRRRRQKDRRHEWEYVYVDGEGEEVEVEEPEKTPARKATQKSSKAPGRQPKGQLKGRSGRTVEPPSWQRA